MLLINQQILTRSQRSTLTSESDANSQSMFRRHNSTDKNTNKTRMQVIAALPWNRMKKSIGANGNFRHILLSHQHTDGCIWLVRPYDYILVFCHDSDLMFRLQMYLLSSYISHQKQKPNNNHNNKKKKCCRIPIKKLLLCDVTKNYSIHNEHGFNAYLSLAGWLVLHHFFPCRSIFYQYLLYTDAHFQLWQYGTYKMTTITTKNKWLLFQANMGKLAPEK